ncbi:endonuclease/exonuclease/phosphatase family protein [Cupriavidus sp. H39]|uniref:endonuclease/exonuclease/phosphatase family protein n=1 Tax=Cupriavidus sp. H39 TaxID=3401635 RepID=UPI003D01A70E
MSKIIVYSWNSQGNHTRADKQRAIDRMAATGPTIIMLQEGGSEKLVSSGAAANWKVFDGCTVGAYDERCTPYVLLETTFAAQVRATQVDIVDERDGVVLAGGVAGRTASGVAIDKVLFISWHSIAAPQNGDTRALLRAFDKASCYEKYDLIVIGGDFNASPEDISAMLGRENDRTQARLRYAYRQVFYCGKATHRGRQERELDFFVVLAKRQVSATVELIEQMPSDHDAVRMVLEH